MQAACSAEARSGGAVSAGGGPMLRDPRVSICILTYNRCELVCRLLDQLAQLAYAPLEILVVDNHSDDGTSDLVASRFPQVRCLRTQHNMGAAGRNVAMKAARGDILVTLDDDVAGLDDAAIRAIVTQFADDPRLGAMNFRIVNERGATCNWVHHCSEEHCFDRDFLTYEITEGAVAFRRQALESAGYYPESFFLSHEGPDLAFRIIERSFRVCYSPAVVVRHAFALQAREPWRNYYYDTRNQFWLAARHFPLAYALRYLGRGLPSMLAYSIRDGYARYWLKGVVDGIAGLPRMRAQRKVLGGATMSLIRAIDAGRPGIALLIRKRLLARSDVLMK